MTKERETSPRRIRSIMSGLVVAVVAGGFGFGTITQATADNSTRRVDLAPPTFSHPTKITNPLFPISELTQVIQLGHEADAKLRTEVTLLPGTRVFNVFGQRVETLRSQFIAYSDGRILEDAIDYYAQADDGSVWYLGEHVNNYEDGVVVNNDGTWLAGRDGPPGMIMPAHPKVGDVYRPENIPGLVFEEVTVKAVNQTVDGPSGRVRGAIVTDERLMDGTHESKTYAPGYGEFSAFAPVDDELVTVAVAVPTDVVRGRVPDALRTILRNANRAFGAASDEDWDRVAALADKLDDATDDYLQRDGVPPLLESQLNDALDALHEAIDTEDADGARQAAIDVAHAALDLQLQYREPSDVDEARIALWLRQVKLDRDADDTANVAGDVATIELIEQRIHDD
jgi:hypothetical protein